jgi:hypothetical protein
MYQQGEAGARWAAEDAPPSPSGNSRHPGRASAPIAHRIADLDQA